jgi:hypothetical protein
MIMQTCISIVGIRMADFLSAVYREQHQNDYGERQNPYTET